VRFDRFYRKLFGNDLEFSFLSSCWIALSVGGSRSAVVGVLW